jgi:hypothetical protein
LQTGTHSGTQRRTQRVTVYGSIEQVVTGTIRVQVIGSSRQVVRQTYRTCCSGTHFATQ